MKICMVELDFITQFASMGRKGKFRILSFLQHVWRRPNSGPAKADLPLGSCARVGGWKKWGGGGGVPATEPTGMFSTSELRAKMRQNNKVQRQIAEAGPRGSDPNARTCRRRGRGRRRKRRRQGF